MSFVTQRATVIIMLSVSALLCGGCADDSNPPMEVIAQQGHAGKIQDAVFSSDGRYLLTCADRHRQPDPVVVVLWDARTGEKLRVFETTGSSFAPQFADRDTAVVCGRHVFDLRSGRVRHELVKAGARLNARSVLPDGRTIVVADGTGTITRIDVGAGVEQVVWRATYWFPSGRAGTPKRVDESTVPALRILDATIHTSGDIVALIEEQTEGPQQHSLAGVWNVSQRRKICDITTGIIDRIRLSPGARFVVSRCWSDTGSSKDDVRIYDSETGNVVLTGTELFPEERSLPFTPDGEHCVLGTDAEVATLYNLRRSKAVCTFETKSRITETEIIASGTVLQLRTENGFHRVDLKSFRTLPVPKAAKGMARDVEFPFVDHRSRRQTTVEQYSPDDLYRIVHAAQEYYLVETASGQILAELASERDHTFDIQWSNDGRRAITRTHGLWRLWDVDHGRVLQSFGYPRTHNAQYRGPELSFSANGQFVFTHGLRTTVWHAETGAPVRDNHAAFNISHEERTQKWTDDSFGIRNYAQDRAYRGSSHVSDDRRLAASFNAPDQMAAGEFAIWDLCEGHIMHRLACRKASWLQHPAFSSENKYFSISDPGQGETTVRDLLDGSIVCRVRHDKDSDQWRSAGAVAFLADNKRLVCCSGSDTLSLVDIASGDTVLEMRDQTLRDGKRTNADVRPDLLLSPDNKYVVADYDTDYSIVWNLETGRQVLRIEVDTGSIPVTRRLWFSDDSTALLHPSNTVRHWNLLTGEYSEHDHGHFTREGHPGFSRRPHPLLYNLARASPLTQSALTLGNAAAPAQSRYPHGALKFDSLTFTNVPDDVLRSLRDRLPSQYVSVWLTKDGRRLLVRERYGRWSAWDVASQEHIATYRRFRFSQEWLTETAGGEWRGATHRTRLREPGTVRVHRP